MICVTKTKHATVKQHVVVFEFTHFSLLFESVKAYGKFWPRKGWKISIAWSPRDSKRKVKFWTRNASGADTGNYLLTWFDKNRENRNNPKMIQKRRNPIGRHNRYITSSPKDATEKVTKGAGHEIVPGRPINNHRSQHRNTEKWGYKQGRHSGNIWPSNKTMCDVA